MHMPCGEQCAVGVSPTDSGDARMSGARGTSGRHAGRSWAAHLARRRQLGASIECRWEISVRRAARHAGEAQVCGRQAYGARQASTAGLKEAESTVHGALCSHSGAPSKEPVLSALVQHRMGAGRRSAQFWKALCKHNTVGHTERCVTLKHKTFQRCGESPSAEGKVTFTGTGLLRGYPIKRRRT